MYEGLSNLSRSSVSSVSTIENIYITNCCGSGILFVNLDNSDSNFDINHTFFGDKSRVLFKDIINYKKIVCEVNCSALPKGLFLDLHDLYYFYSKAKYFVEFRGTSPGILRIKLNVSSFLTEEYIIEKFKAHINLGDFFPFIHFNFLYDSGFFNDRCLKSITSTSHVYPFYSELIIILSNYLKLEPNIMFSYPYSCEFEDITYLGCLRDYYVFCEGDLHDLKGNLIYSSLILLDSPLY